ncbi:LemA family protein, partial [Vibrio sp. 10N.222.49.C9]
VMTKVTELRTSAGGVQEGNINPSALNDVQSKIGALQTAINIVQENYPDLNTHELVTGYMKAVEETQKQVSAALRLFNANTMKYNETLQVFPNNIINNLISRKKKLSFYTDQQAEDNFT